MRDRTDFRAPRLPDDGGVDPQATLAAASFVPAAGGFPVGGLLMYPGGGTPDGTPEFEVWVLADGTELLKADYPELFERYGTRWGTPVDPDYFATPPIVGQGRVIVSQGGPLSLMPGTVGGEAEVALDITELPPHTHPAPSAGFAITNFIGQVAAGAAFGAVNAQAAATGSTGLGVPHNNMPPHIVINTWIRARP